MSSHANRGGRELSKNPIIAELQSGQPSLGKTGYIWETALKTPDITEQTIYTVQTSGRNNEFACKFLFNRLPFLPGIKMEADLDDPQSIVDLPRAVILGDNPRYISIDQRIARAESFGLAVVARAIAELNEDSYSTKVRHYITVREQSETPGETDVLSADAAGVIVKPLWPELASDFARRLGTA